MSKSKEQIAAYNKEYFARPEVIARAKVRNAKRRGQRQAYKKTEAGKLAEKRYRQSEATKERLKRNRLMTRYGLTPENVIEMALEQNNTCKICSSILTSPHIDHCHTTGRVRGILCSSCNLALGLFKDNTEILKSAIKYLEVDNA